MEHLMIREIKEQPAVINRLVADKDNTGIKAAVDAMTETEKLSGNIYLVGNGTSYHACIYGQFLLSVRNKLVINLYDTSEFKNFAENLKPNDTVVLVSQSGETGDAIKLIYRIKDKKCSFVVITNYPKSTLGQAADVVIPMQAGECQAIPNTKGYTASMVIFALIAERYNADENFSSIASQISDDIEIIIQTQYDRLRALADKLHDAGNIFILGHASGLANAYEAALKIKECSHIEAEGYSGLEFRHGPSSVVTTGTPVIVFMADYESEADLGGVLEEIAQPDPFVIGIGSIGHTQFDERYEAFEHNLYAAIPAIVPTQILAYELALAKGVDPDTPSGVQRVVK